MLLTSQAQVAEPGSLVWPHVIIAIFSISTMVSLLTLCVATHCCRNAKKKENPYGEIVTTPIADAHISAVVSRNRTDGSRLHHPSRLSYPSLNLHEQSVHRLSTPLPHSSLAMKRALPKLPEYSARFENKNPGPVYSTIDHATPAIDRNSSFLYGEGPTNPTYESIDIDPSYSKLGNGGPSVKRYDYPVFVPGNQPAITTDDILYQSASLIYAGVSEDPYSSITSHTGGETNYDVGYSHVRGSMNTDTPRYLANAQAGGRSLDHLYSRIRRGPSMNRVTNSSTYRPLPSNEFGAEYISSGSDKTSREPSYRYITVRETVDAIRQRLSELNPPSNIPQSVITDGCGPIREHYYSSIGGSDYETLQISAASTNQPSCDTQDVPSTSCAGHDSHPEAISSAVSICENIPPKPPTSPIPLRITAVKEDNLQRKQPLLSGSNKDEAINDDESRSNISEKIRRLRTNFFDQELLDEFNGPSSTDLRFGQLQGTINQHEATKWINSSGTDRNLDSEHYIDQVSSANFDETYSHLQKLAADKSHIYSARNVTQNALLSTVNRQNVIDEEHCKITADNSKSHCSHEASVFGTKKSVEEDSIFQEGKNDEEQCFIPKRRYGLGKQAENNNSSICFAEALEEPLKSTATHSLKSSNFSRTTSPYQQTSLNKTSNAEKDMEAQSCSDQRSTMELFGENGTESGRLVQTAKLSFSHESIDENALGIIQYHFLKN
ncbi:unnamed protein product [Cercopithifilaria johnstoni]|uniref:Uncharacterized protein n=1 Tax=Cercopithifilaria johnstoni TaxID=2874296 RepID=A0A8J2MKS7_9BILA|nr:unnamed protein product [Cercopithifilaria johnstoni]